MQVLATKEQPAGDLPPDVVPDEFEVSQGKTPGPWKVLIYGTPGCGKSTLATFAPKPFFLDLESGLGRVDCRKTKRRLETYDEVMKWLGWAAAQADVQTVVIDTMDELDNILAKRVCARENKSTLTDIPYGKGGDLLLNEWQTIVRALNRLNERGKNVLLIGHEQVIKFEDPTSENYDRYQLKIHKKSAPLVAAKMDAVLFARYETFVRDKEDGRGRIATGGERKLHTLEAPCWVAKNRFGLPAAVTMDKTIFDLIAKE